MKRNILTIGYFIIITSCSTPTNKVSDQAQISFEQLQANIDSLFHAEIGSDKPGAAVLIAYDGNLLMGKGYGLSDLDNNEHITPSTNMRMASVSKQFTALTMLSLVDKGMVSLQDTLYSYWPYKVFENITIDQLINHTSGLPDYEEAFMRNWDRTRVATNQDVLNWLATDPTLLSVPGSTFQYSNTAYLVLALLIEKISGQDFPSYAQSEIFTKAGMAQTNYYSLANPIDIQERAYCYEKDSLDEWAKVDGFFLNGVVGDGAIYTNIEDYFEYDQALRANSVLSEHIHQLIFQPSSPTGSYGRDHGFTFVERSEEVYYGMGWFLIGDIAFHGGGWYGTRTIVIRELERPLTIAIFRNSDQSPIGLLNATYEWVNKYLRILSTIQNVQP